MGGPGAERGESAVLFVVPGPPASALLLASLALGVEPAGPFGPWHAGLDPARARLQRLLQQGDEAFDDLAPVGGLAAVPLAADP